MDTRNILFVVTLGCIFIGCASYKNLDYKDSSGSVHKEEAYSMICKTADSIIIDSAWSIPIKDYIDGHRRDAKTLSFSIIGGLVVGVTAFGSGSQLLYSMRYGNNDENDESMVEGIGRAVYYIEGVSIGAVIGPIIGGVLFSRWDIELNEIKPCK